MGLAVKRLEPIDRLRLDLGTARFVVLPRCVMTPEEQELHDVITRLMASVPDPRRDLKMLAFYITPPDEPQTDELDRE